MDILNMVFTGLFTVEMLLKLLALRLRVRIQYQITPVIRTPIPIHLTISHYLIMFTSSVFTLRLSFLFLPS